jgi:cytochrome c5
VQPRGRSRGELQAKNKKEGDDLKKTVLLTVILMLVSFLISYAGVSNDEAKALFEEKCNICHTSEYATDKRDTTDGWRMTVLRMRDEMGADLTDKEAEAIIDYLCKHRGK